MRDPATNDYNLPTLAAAFRFSGRVRLKDTALAEQPEAYQIIGPVSQQMCMWLCLVKDLQTLGYIFYKLYI